MGARKGIPANSAGFRRGRCAAGEKKLAGGPGLQREERGAGSLACGPRSDAGLASDRAGRREAGREWEGA